MDHRWMLTAASGSFLYPRLTGSMFESFSFWLLRVLRDNVLVLLSTKYRDAPKVQIWGLGRGCRTGASEVSWGRGHSFIHFWLALGTARGMFPSFFGVRWGRAGGREESADSRGGS